MTRAIVRSLSKILIVFVILQALVINTTYVQALSFGDMFQIADNFIEIGENTAYQTENEVQKEANRIEQTKQISSELYSVLLGVGIALSVVVGAILGIKFMISSVEEKAQIKEALVAYVAGCVVVFGAFGIWNIVIVIGNGI